MAVAAPRRRADGDEHGVGLADRRSDVGDEVEPTGCDIGGNQSVEARFKNRHFATLQSGDLAGIGIDAGHAVAEIGKTGPGDEPDIAGADHGDAHGRACR